MSLISEALKKARQEAARQEAARRGLAPPTLPHHLPLPRRGRPGWLAPLAAGFAGAAGVTAVLLLVLARQAAPPPPVSPREPAVLPISARIEGVPPMATPEAARAEPSVSQPVAPAPPTVSPASLPAPAEVPPRAAAAVPPDRPAPPMAEAAPEETPSPTPPPAARSPGRRAELADGTVLVLQGIAVTDNRPVALINGRAVGPGESVAGWEVRTIEATRVELARGGATVVLGLR